MRDPRSGNRSRFNRGPAELRIVVRKRILDRGPRIPAFLLRFSIVVLRAVDLAAGSIQISLEISAFRAIQSIARLAIHPFLRANRGLVGAQPVQFTPRELIVLPAISDALHLAVFAGIDASRPLGSRLVLREGAQGSREHESKGHRDDSSNQHASSFGHWLSD